MQIMVTYHLVDCNKLKFYIYDRRIIVQHQKQIFTLDAIRKSEYKCMREVIEANQIHTLDDLARYSRCFNITWRATSLRTDV